MFTSMIINSSLPNSSLNPVRRPLSTKWTKTCSNKRHGTKGSSYSRSSSPLKASSRSEICPSTQKPNISLVHDQHETTSAIMLARTPCKPRPTANYHPDVWGDRFLKQTPDDDAVMHAPKEEEIEELKKQVKSELVASAAATNATEQHLNLIDSIQRLGLAYHFEKEIEDILQQVYETSCHQDSNDNDDLYTVSLRFRLLRQQGFDSSSDVFNKFTDENGQFKESLTVDTRGMLSLYEAANFSKPEGDGILDEAMPFTIAHLNNVVMTSSDNSRHPSVPEIVHALKLPLLKNVPRLETRRYIPIYEQDVSHNKDLLKLAKLNFNLLQSMHKREISDLVRWWRELDAERRFPYARSRIVEVFFWTHGIRFEPQFQFSRKILSKTIAVLTVIDDLYDIYATYEELQVFTAAVERWSFSCVDQLPENLKPVYRLLLDTYEEIEQDLANILDQSQRIHYAKRAIKGIIRGYFQEAKWLRDGHVPTMEEYTRNALLTGGYFFMPITFVLGMDDASVTKGALDWFENDTGAMLVAGSSISRLINDIASRKLEREREHIPSSVELYMKENNVSEKEAIDEIQSEVDEAWKVLNEEMIRKPVPMAVLRVILNISRAGAVTYMDEHDGYTNVGTRTQEIIRLLFIDPVAM